MTGETRVAINGFGRIGNGILRASEQYDDIDVVAINDIDNYLDRANRAAHDSTYGAAPVAVYLNNDVLEYGDSDIQLLQEGDAAALPWDDYDVDVVLESTGQYRDRDGASKHLEAGADKVLISAPPKSEDIPQYVYGINHEEYNGEAVVSNASCSTNSVAHILQIFDDVAGLESGFFEEIHGNTGSQNLVDGPASKSERQWSGQENVIPTSSSAASPIEEVLPEIGQKVECTGVRVPILNASQGQYYLQPEEKVSIDELDQAFKKAAEESEFLGYEDNGVLPDGRIKLPSDTVSTMIQERPESVIYDATESQFTDDGETVQLTGWYDNEYGFSNRMLDMADHIADK